MTAWGDESLRFNSDPRAYLLAAAVVEESAADAIREVMRPLHVAGKKLHWRDLGSQQRDKVVDVVTNLEALHVVVIATPLNPAKQERARAKCIERLLAHLADLGVGQLTLEQRTKSLNEGDQRIIAKLRGSRAFPPAMTVEFGVPSTEPLLWLPDVVAGAIGDELTDATTPWAKQLDSCVEMLELDLNAR